MVPALLSWSGGKDAAWTLHAARMHGGLEIVGLLTTLTEGHDRVSMQGIRRDVLHAQARAAGLPLVEAWIPQAATNVIYEAAFGDALAEAARRWPGVRDIAFGDLFLADIKAYRDALCARLGWTPHYPLFGRDTTQLARAMIDGGLRAHLCCVDWADGFGLIRASNTTPVLVLRFEGHTEEALHRIEAKMLALLKRVKPDAQVGHAAH